MQPIVSTKSYLVRAIHEWCSDQGYTPYIVVAVRGKMQVPMEYVKGGEIVLNASYNATRNMMLGNEYITFSARFNGVSREIVIPVGAVVSIFAKENGEGMGFEYEAAEEQGLHSVGDSLPVDSPAAAEPETEPEPTPPAGAGRGHLRVVK
ncbi:MAG: ClpXP protease specificity-enhancing factor [Formivibrio sp.]|nr:ClpXP protease specificity-enhancing factor [Formivibrio sp.]